MKLSHSIIRAVWIPAVFTACICGSAVFDARADLNIVGSLQGAMFQGAALPQSSLANVSVPLSLCDVSPLPLRFEAAANIQDLNDPNILLQPGSVVVWTCQIGGVSTTLRYTAMPPLNIYNNIKAAAGSPQSMFTSIVPAGVGCTSVSGNPKTDPGTGRQYQSSYGCSQRILVSADFAMSDTNGLAFAPTICSPSPPPGVPFCASPILHTGITVFSITAMPLVVVVGNGVQKCDPVTKAAAGKISLTRTQLEAIMSGTVGTWNDLGYCVFPVQPLNPPNGIVGVGAGDMSPVGAAFNAGIDQSIVTCSRPWNGYMDSARVIFDNALMLTTGELTSGLLGPPFAGDFNYLAATEFFQLDCIQGSALAPTSSANMNGIAYLRADSAPSPVQFFSGVGPNGGTVKYGYGIPGRLRAGYPVAVDGAAANTYIPPTNLVNPSDAERAAAQKDLRCGRYALWSNWVGIQRTAGNPNQALWNQYVAQIANLLPKSPGGYFIARDLRQPGQPINSEMVARKTDVRGPISFPPGDPPGCR